MDESKTVSLSPSEAQEFWAGPDARSIAPEPTPAIPEYAAQCPELRDPVVDDLRAAFLAAEANKSCCVGVDLPEVGGRVHSENCPHAGSPVRSGRGHGAGDVSQSRDYAGTVNDDRDAILVELVFAAMHLAERNIHDPWRDGPLRTVTFAGCQECEQPVHLGSRPHLATCKTGRVLGVIDRLLALPFHPSRKEAPEGEIRAEAGNPSRGTDSAIAQADGCGSLLDRADVVLEEPREWVIQRCTQKWIGCELQYEDVPTPEGSMTYREASVVLLRVVCANPGEEFRAHRVRIEGGAQ